MFDRSGIFAGDDPFKLASSWFDEARKTEINDPDAVALASVDAQGMPNVRMVLLRYIEKDAFVFFTNYNSVKAQELFSAGAGAFVVHWKTLRRQIRVRGHISKEAGPLADTYFKGRSPLSQIGAYVSKQSQPLRSREHLIAQVKQVKDSSIDISRPENWGGIRVKPIEIEFWSDGEARLHDRFRWLKKKDSSEWDIQRLYP